MIKHNYLDRDRHSIQLSGSKITIELNGNAVTFDESDKKFQNDTGEAVVEYSGNITDGNQQRSWAKATYRPEAYSQLHYHEQREEDYYIIAGHAKVVIDGVEHHLSPGQHIQISPGKQHQVINESKHEELILIVKCAPSWIREDFHLVNADSYKPRSPRR